MAVSTFTQFLLHNEYASLSELEEGSQATVLFGARLGTALIELGVMSAEQLDVALARYHGLPDIPAEWLAKPDAAARAALHVDLVKRHRAFPLQFEKRTLHVGLLDPRNDAVLDDLAFASGCLIAPYALTEFRFVQLMQRVYSVAPSRRFKALLDERARAEAFRARAMQRKSSADERSKQHETLEIGPLAADLESDADAYFVVEQPRAQPEPVKAPAKAKPAPPAAPTKSLSPAPISKRETPAIAAQPELEIDDMPILLDRRAEVPAATSIAALERVLAESSDRGQVIEASVELAARFAEVVALLVIRDGVAAGMAAIRGGKPLEIDATVIPLAAENALAACVASKKPMRANPGAALDKLLAKALRSPESAELAVYPVLIGERVVNLLVAQAEQGTLGATADAALSALAPLISGAYARLILVQKQKTIAPAATPAATPAQVAAPKSPAAIGALPLTKRVVKAPARN